MSDVGLDTFIANTVEVAVRNAVADVLADLVERPLVVDANQAAHLLGVSRSTIESWVATGVLPRLPHTTRLLIPRKAIEDLATAS